MNEETNKSFEYRIKHDRDFVIEQHRKCGDILQMKYQNAGIVFQY